MGRQTSLRSFAATLTKAARPAAWSRPTADQPLVREQTSSDLCDCDPQLDSEEATTLAFASVEEETAIVPAGTHSVIELEPGQTLRVDDYLLRVVCCGDGEVQLEIVSEREDGVCDVTAVEERRIERPALPR